MQVSKITGVPYSNKSRNQQLKNTDLNKNNLSFKNFSSAMSDVYHVNIKDVYTLNAYFRKLFKELMNEPNLTKYYNMEILEKFYNFTPSKYYLSYEEGIQGLLDCMCIEKSKVPYQIKDTVERVKRDKFVPLIDKGYGDKRENALYLEYHGKYGFFNNIFRSDEDRNDIRLVMKSGFDKFTVGLNEEHRLRLYRSTLYESKCAKYNLLDLVSESISSSPGEVTVVC